MVVVSKIAFVPSKVKPMAFGSPEGRRPECDMASAQVTTGVLDQGMYLRGEFGNSGEPIVSLHKQR